MDIENFSLDQGTIEFWVKANKFEWNNDERIELFEASRDKGKVAIFKDKENKLKGVYSLKQGKEGETSLDVSGLSSQKRHHVAFTWNQQQGQVTLYLDNKQVAQDKIN